MKQFIEKISRLVLFGFAMQSFVYAGTTDITVIANGFSAPFEFYENGEKKSPIGGSTYRIAPKKNSGDKILVRLNANPVQVDGVWQPSLYTIEFSKEKGAFANAGAWTWTLNTDGSYTRVNDRAGSSAYVSESGWASVDN